MPPDDEPWPSLEGVTPLPQQIIPFSPEYAREAFMARFVTRSQPGESCMKTGPGSGFEMTKHVPVDKPENYSVHTQVSDHVAPRMATITPGPSDACGAPVQLELPLDVPETNYFCTCHHNHARDLQAAPAAHHR
jgi:hypothetical protein